MAPARFRGAGKRQDRSGCALAPSTLYLPMVRLAERDEILIAIVCLVAVEMVDFESHHRWAPRIIMDEGAAIAITLEDATALGRV